MLDLHISEHGYTEIYPPYLVQTRDAGRHRPTCRSSRDNLYHDVRGRRLADPDRRGAGDQPAPRRDPRRQARCRSTTSPTRPASAASSSRRGRDVRGIKRGHQFDKVEMVKFVDPETQRRRADDAGAAVADVSARRWRLPYRVVQMCTGDLSFTAAKKYDLEVWAPGCGEWLEVSSLLELPRFPGAAREHPLPARRPARARVRPHAERLGTGAAAHDDRDHGELPAGRRFDRRPRRATALSRRSGADRPCQLRSAGTVLTGAHRRQAAIMRRRAHCEPAGLIGQVRAAACGSLRTRGGGLA